MNSILLVDSEIVPSTALQSTLMQFGFEAELATSATEAHTWIKKSQFDLILVEFDLSPRPNGEMAIEPSSSAVGSWSGTGLIRELRASGITAPILVHTALEGDLYETASLDAGADDYIIKRPPISTLLSRIHAHLRRRERDLGLAAKAERRSRIGRFTLDRKTRILLADETPVMLSNREIRLLEKLASSPSRIFSQNEILDDVWGDDLRNSPIALASCIKRLRQKMEKSGLADPIENLRGKGFKLAASILHKN